MIYFSTDGTVLIRDGDLELEVKVEIISLRDQEEGHEIDFPLNPQQREAVLRALTGKLGP